MNPLPVAKDVADATPIIDFHAHAFPDALAPHAIQTLEGESNEVRAHLDGRVSSLLDSMDRAGILASVVCSIATKPSQFQPILDWSLGIRSERIIPLASVHPEDPERFERIAAVRAAGLIGIKLHPYYQRFVLDAPPILDMLRCARDHNLMVVSHTGFDIAFPRERIADPERVRRVIEKVDGLCFVATHLGGWSDWDEVERCLAGVPVYRELSYALGWMPEEQSRALIASAPDGMVLFGTDSPWNDQAAERDKLRALGLGHEREAAVLHDNAARLLKRLSGA